MHQNQSLSIFDTRTWRVTLGEQSEDGFANYRAQLRSAFIGLHSRVSDLVSNIHVDFREYTVHDINHLDALWSMADKITGEDYKISPTEGFLLGCAFLLHDAGMCLAAYPGGLDEVKSSPNWALAIARARDRIGINAPQDLLVADVIRQLHAERAADLPNIKWKSPDGQEYYLIDNPDIRHRFGSTIGKISASHWWDVIDIQKNLNTILPAPHFLPGEWQADLMKVAAILRICDAAHIDETRAPGFLWALRKPGSYSNLHWKFQNRLFPARTEKDAIEFRSEVPFKVEDADAWWQCFDALNLIDNELRSVDVMLADARHSDARLNIRRVSNAGNPLRLCQNIEVLDWIPIDTRISITDIPDLVRKLGGEALYGQRPHVPIRELIQNSIEAIALRAEICSKAHIDFVGKIEVRYMIEGSESYIEILDNGIGMTGDIIVKYLLDFGKTGWNKSFDASGSIQNNLAKIGKFGIGFFSSLMISDKIDLYTRRYDAALDDTLHISFNNGINSRPILSKASHQSRLLNGGTRIKLYLREKITLFQKNRTRRNFPTNIHELCHELFPLIFCEIKSTDNTGTIVKPSVDISKTNNIDLMKACFSKVNLDDNFLRYVNNIRPLDPENPNLGRLALFPESYWRFDPDGMERYLSVLSSNGIKVSHWSHVLGFVEGIINKASRDSADVNISSEKLAKWATDQANLLSEFDLDLNERRTVVEFIVQLGGDPGNISFIETNKGVINVKGLISYLKKRKIIMIASHHYWRSAKEFDSSLCLKENVIVFSDGHSLMNSDGEDTVFDDLFSHIIPYVERRSTQTLIAECISLAWSVPIQEVRKKVDYRWHEEDNNEEQESLYSEEFIFSMDNIDHKPAVPVIKLSRKTFLK